jgi:hypothetical protein
MRSSRHDPVMRTVNNEGDRTLFGRTDFIYEPESDTYIRPGENAESLSPLSRLFFLLRVSKGDIPLSRGFSSGNLA